MKFAWLFPLLTHIFNLIVLLISFQVIEANADMPVVGAITLYVSLLTFTLRVHPDRLDYVDQVLVSSFIFSSNLYSHLWIPYKKMEY